MKKNTSLSAQSLICGNATKCGDVVTDTLIKNEFAYAKTVGLTSEQCIPYTGNPADCPADSKSCKTPGVKYETFKCGEMTYETDANKAKAEIMKSGPVMCLFTPTKDYKDYYDGIYYAAHSKRIDTVAVKIIGWGKENSLPYWLVETFMGAQNGENGYARIDTGFCKSFYYCSPI
jgi:hypothetical protein